MYPYAQTNIQLLNHLRREGYSNAELGLVRDTYELSIGLYTGCFVGSGRTQIAHVVGTASILASLHVPAEVVAAALIHNVYETGDFGDGHNGISKAKRREIEKAVGEKVERYVYRFREARLSPHSTSQIQDDPVDRYALLVEFADRLDHHLNDGCIDKYRLYIDHNGPFMAEMAEKLGYPTLAVELERAFREPVPNKALVEVIRKISPGDACLIAPISYRRRLRVELYQNLARGIHYLYSFTSVKKKLHKLVRWFYRLRLTH